MFLAVYVDVDEEDEVDQENISELAKDARRKGRWDHFFSVRGRYCSCNLPAALGDQPEEGRDAVKKAAAKRKFIAYLSKLIRPYFKAVSLKCHCTANHRVVRSVEKILIYVYRWSSRKTELSGRKANPRKFPIYLSGRPFLWYRLGQENLLFRKTRYLDI